MFPFLLDISKISLCGDIVNLSPRTGRLVYPEDTRAVAKAMQTEKGAIAPARLNREGYADGQAPVRAGGVLMGYNLSISLGGRFMSAISFSRFRRNPSKIIEAVVDNDEPVTITRADGKDVVVVPLYEFESWKETRHLLSSRKNVKRLRESMSEIEAEIARRHR